MKTAIGDRKSEIVNHSAALTRAEKVARVRAACERAWERLGITIRPAHFTAWLETQPDEALDRSLEIFRGGGAS